MAGKSERRISLQGIEMTPYEYGVLMRLCADMERNAGITEGHTMVVDSVDGDRQYVLTKGSNGEYGIGIQAKDGQDAERELANDDDLEVKGEDEDGIILADKETRVDEVIR